MYCISGGKTKIFQFKQSEESYRIRLDKKGFVVETFQGKEKTDFLKVANLLKGLNLNLFKKLTESLHPLDPNYEILKKSKN